MEFNEWNITDDQGKTIIINLLDKLVNKKNIDFQILPQLLKKTCNKDGIKIKRNGKRRNINNYIKVKYGGFYNLLFKLGYISKINIDKESEEKYYIKEKEKEYVII